MGHCFIGVQVEHADNPSVSPLLPNGHAKHPAANPSVLKVPFGQLLHWLVACEKYFPLSHPLTQVVPSADGCVLPEHTRLLVQSVLALEPGELFGVSLGQFAHSDILVAPTVVENLPDGQFWHWEAEATCNCGWYVPAGHGSGFTTAVPAQ